MSIKSHILTPLTILGASLASLQAEKKTPPETPAFSDAVEAGTILKVSNAVADWQLANPYKREDWDWTEGALWTGLMAHVHTTGEEKYHRALLKVSEDLLWHFLRDELPHQLNPTRKIMDLFTDRPHDEDLLWQNHVHMREWAWCDALYMAPPTLAMLHAATGNPKYLQTIDEQWWKTSNYLYDKDSSLYWRDSKYITKKEANGEKVFWSRGNGWVFAGLCHVLQYMPADHPTRAAYIQQFKEMAVKLKSIQQPDGSWHASLLDPASFPVPESSGTAFFTYGFLWGINNGILAEADYKEPAVRGWKRLVKNVHADGKLGYVQPVGENPKSVTFDQSAVYGVGGFLLAAHELYKHLILSAGKSATFTATNPSRQNRRNEVVPMDWKKATSLVAGLTKDNVTVRDTVTGYFLPVQVVDNDSDGTADTLFFQTDFTPKEKRKFQLFAAGKPMPQMEKSQLMARFVPERKDDFVWENDRIAYRAYGPALAVENARGGIYHKDNGTGLDGYKVNDTLGCGGVGYLDADGKLHTSPVFSEYEGPLRLKFTLSYAPVEIGAAKITETRTFTMLAGDHHYTVNSSFKVEGNATGIRPVTGIATRDPKTRASFASRNCISYRDPIMAKDAGYINTFIFNHANIEYKVASRFFSFPRPLAFIYAKPKERTVREKNHFLEVLADDLTKPVSFSSGAVWCEIESHKRLNMVLMLLLIEHNLSHPITIK